MLRSRFLWKLYTGYSAIIVISAVVVGALMSRGVERDARKEIRQSLQAQANLLKKPSVRYFQQPNTQSFPNYVNTLGKELSTRLTLIGADGVVIADSAEDPDDMNNHADRPEILEARSNGVGTSIRFSDFAKTDTMYLALPIQSKGTILGYIRTSLPLSRIDHRLGQIRTAIAWGTGLSAAAALIVGFLLAYHFVRPLSAITVAAESISRGDYDHRLPMSRNDEIGNLAGVLHLMAESCRDRTETIVTGRNRLSAILSGMTEGVVAIEQDEQVLHLNEAAGRLLDVSPKECLGKPIWEVIRVPEIPDMLTAALSGKSETQGNLQFATRSRKDQFIEVHTAPLRNAQETIVGAVAVLHDVSELHKLETVRSEFVANASHELKTPITAIRGLVETLIDDKKLAGPKRQRFLGKIKDQSMRLSSIVTDLLTLSRLESERTKAEGTPFDLRKIVLASARVFMPMGQEHGIAVETQVTDTPIDIMGDAEAIRQVISNLLDNAIKYTSEGGRIWVRLEVRDGHAVVEVQDTGIGIARRDQDRIFERSYRVDKARSRELGGTGLGLSIVKHIAITHGGHVSVNSTPGAGSTFRVFLPLTSARRKKPRRKQPLQHS